MKTVAPLVHVTAVEVLEGFTLRLTFDDGTTHEVDTALLLRGPVFAALREDPELFARVEVDPQLGTVVWPNGADIDPVVLRGLAEPAWREAPGADEGPSPRAAEG